MTRANEANSRALELHSKRWCKMNARVRVLIRLYSWAITMGCVCVFFDNCWAPCASALETVMNEMRA